MFSMTLLLTPFWIHEKIKNKLRKVKTDIEFLIALSIDLHDFKYILGSKDLPLLKSASNVYLFHFL